MQLKVDAPEWVKHLYTKKRAFHAFVDYLDEEIARCNDEYDKVTDADKFFAVQKKKEAFRNILRKINQSFEKE